MLATIALSPYIQIQGVVTRRLPTGQVAIRHAGREYVGQPVNVGGGRQLRVAE